MWNPNKSPNQTVLLDGRASLIVLCSVLAAVCGGCRSVDSKIDRLMRDADARTGVSGAPVSIDRVDAHRSSVVRSETSPETVNPNSSELQYLPADPARDVNARLQEYSAAATNDARTLSLSDALRIAQRSGREYLNAEEEYLLAAISLLIERHLWGPRFFNDLTAGISGDGDEGRFEHAATIINTLRATKRLPSGGSIEAKAVWNATDQLRERATGGYEQSSRLAIGAQIPLLRGAGEIAREDLIQAERDLVYKARSFERFRREYLTEISNDYFVLLQSRNAISNQENQLRSLERLARSTRERVEAGRREAFEADLASNRVLSAEADLASLRERYILQLDRFKVRLGLGVDDRVAVSDEIFELPEPEISPEEATNLALNYRLDLQNERDQLEDSRRAVRNARNQLLPDLSIAGEVSVPTDNDDATGGLDIDSNETDYDVSATLSLPLDRERERLELRRRLVELGRQTRNYEQSRDEVVVSVRAALRNIEQARFQLKLSEKQVEINTRRLEGQKLKSDQIDPQDVVNAENDKLDAENQRDRAITELRNAVLNYLLESDQLRVDNDGQLIMLPGMSVTR